MKRNEIIYFLIETPLKAPGIPLSKDKNSLNLPIMQLSLPLALMPYSKKCVISQMEFFKSIFH
jgi:hypothetical protein